ncbi:hypothetical protein BX600DRAFT_273414 [Xylariales sp. PMI_506]|nr:hypothetical protein BX600DRAFT_273414 [Xylariales sp. PMI_506]
MLRRAHKKAKRGAKCDECRRRHIRCDQQRPICINCAQADRNCSYPTLPARAQPAPAVAQHDVDSPPATVESILTPATSPDQDHSAQLLDALNGKGEQRIESLINLDHIELFHHFDQIVAPFFVGKDPEFGQEYRQIYFKAGTAGPYLMHEMLAFAAKHLSKVVPASKSKFYQEQAAILQTRALGLFTASVQPNPETFISTFLFSSLLGLHLLTDTINFRTTDIDAYLNRFANYLTIHRGVRPIFEEYRSALFATGLRPFLMWGWTLATSKGAGSECSSVRQLVNEAVGRSSVTTEACIHAIDVLQSLIDARKTRPDFPGPGVWVSIWFNVIRQEYKSALFEKQPEALIVFAYYGAMLHYFFQDFWMINDSGKDIVNMVVGSLDDSWKPWLEWPLEIIRFRTD